MPPDTWKDLTVSLLGSLRITIGEQMLPAAPFVVDPTFQAVVKAQKREEMIELLKYKFASVA